jgi:hypothetical protein
LNPYVNFDVDYTSVIPTPIESFERNKPLPSRNQGRRDAIWYDPTFEALAICFESTSCRAV